MLLVFTPKEDVCGRVNFPFISSPVFWTAPAARFIVSPKPTFQIFF
ncbi:hypothetical protein SeSA_A4486 [Salmonella enterica subsp. enterica serovar Schwarzengrund str. CVM19633]|uniref:Uncharacterized protein n=1 Tax=Salmonella schwarzengrund (strain CVM19633) TaxID=439843 RepID=A0A0N1QU06_SALSV|nr:hypothetical protein SeSA_A4486 [Salmonella enterica subsp. enterica serovar Schwarzengrund str. CVM19633]